MPDMLVRLYDLPDDTGYYKRAAAQGFTIRRAEAWERATLVCFVREQFNAHWAAEATQAFTHSPITAYVAARGAELIGFAAFECTRRGFFGPTGVREEDRGNGLGAALLFRCLESMREMGYGYAVIGGVGPAAFYEKVCGAFLIPGSEISVYRPSYESMSREPR